MNPLDRIVILVFTAVQLRIAVLLWRAAGRRFTGSGRWPARAATVLFDLVVAFGYFCSWSDPVSRLGLPGRPAAMFGAVTLAYLMSAAMLLVLYAMVEPLKRHFAANHDPARRRALNAAGNVVMAAPLALMGYGSFIGRTDFRVRELDVPVAGLAPDLEGLRVLQLSDIHLSAFLSESELVRVIDAACEIRSNLTVITGDLISTRGDPLDACIRQLSRLKADAGLFGCMGNHERYARIEEYCTEAGRRAGIRFLRQQSQGLRFGSATLNLVGVDYQSLAGKKQYLRGAERFVEPGACNVLLSHNPDVFPVAAQQGYNFVLAGHTHGGQVTVEILDQSLNPARFVTPYVYGLYRYQSATAYVTRGIGTIGLPTRIGAPPEISVLRLRKA